MTTTFLGIPFLIWGLLCLVLTVIWVFVWPSGKAIGTDGLRAIILRWFHALVWLLLAASAFIAGFNVLGGESTARFVAFLSLITYLIFMFTLVTSK